MSDICKNNNYVGVGVAGTSFIHSGRAVGGTAVAGNEVCICYDDGVVTDIVRTPMQVTTIGNKLYLSNIPNNVLVSEDDSMPEIEIENLDFEIYKEPDQSCTICKGKGYYWDPNRPLVHEFLGGVPYKCACEKEQIRCKQFPDDKISIEEVFGEDAIAVRIGEKFCKLSDEEGISYTHDFFITWGMKEGLLRL